MLGAFWWANEEGGGSKSVKPVDLTYILMPSWNAGGYLKRRRSRMESGFGVEVNPHVNIIMAGTSRTGIEQ